MKINILLLAISLPLFAQLPKERMFIKNEKELGELAQRLKPLQAVWLQIPLAKSFENRVIQKMACSERWQSLRAWHPLTLDEYLLAITQSRLTILHQEPHRFYLTGQSLSQWIEEVLAPRIGLDPIEHKAFAADFLLNYGQDSAICRELLTQVINN